VTLLLRLLALGIGLWIGLSFAFRRQLGRTTDKVRRTAYAVDMPDGVALSTDLFEPTGPGPHPTLLMRLPYGRAGFAPIALAYARRGFNVVVQACRGTENSGGDFNPLANERADGLATLEWIKRQSWFDGRLGLTGPSYLGFTQWAIADAPEVKAMAVKVSSAEFRSVVFPGGAFHLNLWLSWLQVIEGLRGVPLLFSARMLAGDVERRTWRASLTLPLIEADVAVAGKKVAFWRDWFENAIEDGPFWHAMDHRVRLGPTAPPVHLMSGWYDFMLDQLLADYHRLTEAGRTPYLTISASTHIGGGHDRDNPVETLAWMRAYLMGDHSGLRRQPVAIEIAGTGRWHEFDSFPPGPPQRVERRYLLPDRGLSTAPALPAQPSRYRYDPADPTPNLGGAIFAFRGAGPVPQRTLEARPDVLVFTSAPLADPLTIIGNATALVFMRASIPHADLFVRLCDVDGGRSMNVCDGFVRTTPETPRDADGIMAIELRLHATAHCFLRGHRLRLQVSSGAHPRYARNMGTDEPIGTATTLVAADVEIFHDNRHPSKLELPVYEVE